MAVLGNRDLSINTFGIQSGNITVETYSNQFWDRNFDFCFLKKKLYFLFIIPNLKKIEPTSLFTFQLKNPWTQNDIWLVQSFSGTLDTQYFNRKPRLHLCPSSQLFYMLLKYMSPALSSGNSKLLVDGDWAGGLLQRSSNTLLLTYPLTLPWGPSINDVNIFREKGSQIDKKGVLKPKPSMSNISKVRWWVSELKKWKFWSPTLISADFDQSAITTFVKIVISLA